MSKGQREGAASNRRRHTLVVRQNTDVRGYIGIVDGDWYRLLADLPEGDRTEVNFWRRHSAVGHSGQVCQVRLVILDC